jgi:hypothetical protein
MLIVKETDLTIKRQVKFIDYLNSILGVALQMAHD